MYTIPPHRKKTMQCLSFNVTNTEDSVLLSCTNTLALVSVLTSDKVEKKIPSGAKLVISQGDRSDTHTINKKT